MISMHTTSSISSTRLNIPIRIDLGQDDISPYPELIEVLKKEAHRLEYTSYKGIQELREKIA